MSALQSSTQFDVPAAALAANVRRDLLAECTEMLIAEAVGVLTACRWDDDAAIVEQFRRLDQVYRAAKVTASEIRDGGRK